MDVHGKLSRIDVVAYAYKAAIYGPLNDILPQVQLLKKKSDICDHRSKKCDHKCTVRAVSPAE
jgi:hypothetical protein